MTDMPDFQDPEIRAMVYNQLLEMQQQVDYAWTFAKTMAVMPFEDLTPKHWSNFKTLLPSVVSLIGYVDNSLRQAGVVMDDEEATNLVTKLTALHMENEKNTP